MFLALNRTHELLIDVEIFFALSSFRYNGSVVHICRQARSEKLLARSHITRYIYYSFGSLFQCGKKADVDGKKARESKGTNFQERVRTKNLRQFIYALSSRRSFYISLFRFFCFSASSLGEQSVAAMQNEFLIIYQIRLKNSRLTKKKPSGSPKRFASSVFNFKLFSDL